jgi:NADP-dependent 3-hydroxy acid dehydrogenase YdfG
VNQQYKIQENRKGVVVITGISLEIGQICSRAFAEEGYDVVLLDQDIVALKTAKKEVESFGQQAIFYQVDIYDTTLPDDFK